MTTKGAPDNASRAPGGRCFFFYFLYTLLMIIYRCTYDDEDQHDDHLGPRPLRPLRPSPAGAAAAAGGGGGSAGLEMWKVSSLGMFFFKFILLILIYSYYVYDQHHHLHYHRNTQRWRQGLVTTFHRHVATISTMMTMISNVAMSPRQRPPPGLEMQMRLKTLFTRLVSGPWYVF